jgi:oligopeptide/dipeptide ABC transporter ATP-binding protein
VSDGGASILEVERLRVGFRTEAGLVRAVEDVSLSLRSGEVLALVGESGSGKSVTAMTLLGLTRSPNTDIEGRVLLRGHDLVAAPEAELRRVRGDEIAMVFQDPMSALNPVHRVGAQVAEQIRAHRSVSRGEAADRAVALLGRVGLPAPRERARSFPHELSGGMRQRVMIAMALSCDPAVLVADEPTTALDVTLQAQILGELRALRSASGTAMLLVTHDLGVVAEVADRVAVMYAGRIVETGTVEQIFYDPQHPYTWGLLGSIARVDRPRARRLPSIPGVPPAATGRPEGCHFRPRCPHEFGDCLRVPGLEARVPQADGHRDRCWLPAEDKRRRRVVGDGLIGLDAEGATA